MAEAGTRATWVPPPTPHIMKFFSHLNHTVEPKFRIWEQAAAMDAGKLGAEWRKTVGGWRR